jgi:hypothetical protein
MDIKQEFREEKNMDVYAMNVNDGSFSNVYVKWLEAKINYTRCCTELPNECGLLKNINGCDKGSGCRYPNCV